MLLMIDNYDSFTYNLVQYFGELEQDVCVYRNDKISIDEIENYNRGIYTGSVGYLCSNGYMNFNVAIRTLVFNQNNGIYPVGGGIVWDSTPEGERIEALNKAKIINHMLDNQTKEHG